VWAESEVTLLNAERMVFDISCLKGSSRFVRATSKGNQSPFFTFTPSSIAVDARRFPSHSLRNLRIWGGVEEDKLGFGGLGVEVVRSSSSDPIDDGAP
jgi:hypothetical protein